jgi:hypothetical protein
MFLVVQRTKIQRGGPNGINTTVGYQGPGYFSFADNGQTFSVEVSTGPKKGTRTEVRRATYIREKGRDATDGRVCLLYLDRLLTVSYGPTGSRLSLARGSLNFANSLSTSLSTVGEE